MNKTNYNTYPTGESTYEKPTELMRDEELAEHLRFVKAKEAAEKYVKRIDELQTEVSIAPFFIEDAFIWKNPPEVDVISLF